MIVNKEQFFEIQKKISNISFEQTKEWLERGSIETLCKVHFFVDSIDNPQIACWGRVTSKRFFGDMLWIDGISYSPHIDHKTLTSFFKSLISDKYVSIEISDHEVYSPNFEIGIRRAGFIRPWGLTVCPMSIIVDLQKDFCFHRNWRRNVKKSRDLGNLFIHIEKPSERDALNFIELFRSLTNRKGLEMSLSLKEVYTLFNGAYDLFFITDKNGKYLSGRIEYKCGDLIYDTIAATTPDGIKSGAAYHIQEEIFYYYKSLGFKRFDYGRIPPSNNKMDDLYVAKSFSGGRPVGYNGQFMYTNSRLKSLLFSFYQFVLKKGTCY